MKHDRFLVRAIGYVENDFSVPAAPALMRAADSRIVLDPALSQGVRGLKAGGQILVVFRYNRSTGYSLLQHPGGKRTLLRLGVFALPSPNRPNPIGVSIVDLLAVEANVLLVRGLDAIDGTPVLDIKPPLNSVIELAKLLMQAQARAVSRLTSADRTDADEEERKLPERTRPTLASLSFHSSPSSFSQTPVTRPSAPLSVQQPEPNYFPRTSQHTTHFRRSRQLSNPRFVARPGVL